MTKTLNKTRKKTKTTWRTVRLGDFANINPSVPLERGRTYPFIDMANVIPLSRTTNWLEHKVFTGSGVRFSEGDTLFARITPCLENGKITQAVKTGGVGFGSTEFYVLRGKREISDSDFIFYLTRTYRIRKMAEASMMGASGRQRVERAAFENILVQIPESIDTQKRIAGMLSAFDEKIENNNLIIKTLEQMAQAVFKEWFVNFRFPGHEKIKFVDSALLPAPQSEAARQAGGKVPKGWRVGIIGDLVRITSGFPFSSKLYNSAEGALGVVTIKNVQDGNFIRDFNSFIKKGDLPVNFNTNCYLKEGDILLSLTGNVGRVCFVYGGQYLLNQRVAKLEPKELKDFAFCYFLFRQATMQNYLINMGKGSAQPNLSPVETGASTMLIPPRRILDDFNELAGSIYQQIIQNTVENQKLATMRDLLLPRLMSGEIRV